MKRRTGYLSEQVRATRTKTFLVEIQRGFVLPKRRMFRSKPASDKIAMSFNLTITLMGREDVEPLKVVVGNHIPVTAIRTWFKRQKLGVSYDRVIKTAQKLHGMLYKDPMKEDQ